MVKIVTDSTGYLPLELLEQYDIRVVPLNVHFGEDQVYQEGVNLTNDEFYKMLAEAPELPTTSQPSPGQFRDVFGELTEAGHQVVCIVISQRMSGTYQSALEASRAFPDADVAVIDSEFVAGGLAVMTLTAAEMTGDGRSLDQIVKRVEQMKQDTRLFFVVDTLEYLQKGGRIGTASALLGTMLKVKPILTVSEGIVQPVDRVRTKRKASALLGTMLKVKPILTVSEGIVQPVDRVRTKRKAVQRVLAEMEDSVSPNQPVLVTVMHALAPDEARELESEVQRRLQCERILTIDIGSVVGIHTGPGVVGAAICPIAWPVDVNVAEDHESRVSLPG
jgi:DegV family protein with EDD domain